MHDPFDLSQRDQIPYSTDGLRRLPQYHVIVNNCECHDQFQVEMALMQFVGLSRELAYQKMMAVHVLGKSIVATTHKEAAEHYAALLQYQALNNRGHGLDVSVEAVKP
jgi:ATP-dependent Clp protease adapter protein ClpS